MFARSNVVGARRLAASSHAPAVAMFPRLTTALGTGAIMLYQRDDGPDVTVIAAATPVIVLGPRFASELPQALAGEIRALLARAVELTRPEHVVFAGLPAPDATRLVTSVARLFGSPALREAVSALLADEDVQRAHDEVVKAALPVKLRTRLEHLLQALPPYALDNARYLAACHRTADRAALLVGGDPLAIVAAAKSRGDSTEHLIKSIGDPRWLPLRQKLGVGIR
jgi:hypothetical protein